MNVRIQFFSFLRTSAGQNELTLELPAGATIADLLAQLSERQPRLRDVEQTVLIAIGVEFAGHDAMLHEGDVVSLMPPLQGGSSLEGEAPAEPPDELLITDQPIAESEAAVGAVGSDVGGVAVFWGVVRDREDGRPIAALEYTAYREMAEHQFRLLLADTRRRWPVKRIRVIHRLGRIAVGEPSLLVRVEAAHRGEAFAAAQFIIDELKEKVPIWKQAAPVAAPV